MKARILIVDDNPINLKLAAEVLSVAGFDIVRATDADQAQQVLRDFVPDLILMDIGLPGTDGLTFTRQLKAQSRLCEVPVVALTAAAMKGDERKAIDAGCAGYITKPIDTRAFPDTVRTYLQRAR